MNKIAILVLSVMLTGCFGSNTLPPDPYPADADLQGVGYPLRTGDSDAALGDAYLRALGEIDKANTRLRGVRKAKKRYQDLIEDQN